MLKLKKAIPVVLLLGLFLMSFPSRVASEPFFQGGFGSSCNVYVPLNLNSFMTQGRGDAINHLFRAGVQCGLPEEDFVVNKVSLSGLNSLKKTSLECSKTAKTSPIIRYHQLAQITQTTGYSANCNYIFGGGNSEGSYFYNEGKKIDSSTGIYRTTTSYTCPSSKLLDHLREVPVPRNRLTFLAWCNSSFTFNGLAEPSSLPYAHIRLAGDWNANGPYGFPTPDMPRGYLYLAGADHGIALTRQQTKCVAHSGTLYLHRHQMERTGMSLEIFPRIPNGQVPLATSTRCETLPLLSSSAVGASIYADLSCDRPKTKREFLARSLINCTTPLDGGFNRALYTSVRSVVEEGSRTERMQFYDNMGFLPKTFLRFRGISNREDFADLVY